MRIRQLRILFCLVMFMTLKQRLQDALNCAHNERLSRRGVNLDVLADYGKFNVPGQMPVHARLAIDRCVAQVRAGVVPMEGAKKLLLGIIISACATGPEAASAYIDIHPRVSDNPMYLAALEILKDTKKEREALAMVAELKKTGNFKEALDLLDLVIPLLKAAGNESTAASLERVKGELAARLNKPLDELPLSELTRERIHSCDDAGRLASTLRREDVKRNRVIAIPIIERIQVLDAEMFYGLEVDPAFDVSFHALVHARIVDFQLKRIAIWEAERNEDMLIGAIRATSQPCVFNHLTDEAALNAVVALYRLKGEGILMEIVADDASINPTAVDAAKLVLHGVVKRLISSGEAHKIRGMPGCLERLDALDALVSLRDMFQSMEGEYSICVALREDADKIISRVLEKRFNAIETDLIPGNMPVLGAAVSKMLALAEKYPDLSEPHVDRIIGSLLEKELHDVLALISGGSHGS